MPQLLPAQIWEGVQGTIPMDHCPLLFLGILGGYQPWFCATGLGGRNCHRAEKAVLSRVGFYTNKIKYHRQVGLCVTSSAALVGRLQAVVTMACARVTGGEWSGGCRPHLPADVVPALSTLTVAEL